MILTPYPSSLTPLRVTGLYLFITIAFTWPLALGLTRDIPWDLGDSLLNCWILAWDADHLLRFLSGDFQALKGFWNGNIFHPEPLTLAYSEHLFAQAIQILPVYALTHNVILCYNLLFLSTFVLSGLGMFLFVREVTGSPRAGFVAGLIYAFAPLRVPQFAHLQVLSSQWMPFVLYGLRRYFDSISRARLAHHAPIARHAPAFAQSASAGKPAAPLIGAGAALVAQNLSCGYFLLFFAPCVVAYVLFEVASRRLWTNVRMWTAIGATAILVSAVTLPFLLPYMELRRLGFPPRSLTEVKTYSADVYSYWTSPAESRLWGRTIRAFPKNEGDLFPTFSAMLLGAVGLMASARLAWHTSRGQGARTRALLPLVYFLIAGCAIYALAVVLIMTNHGFASIGPLPISARSLARPFRILVIGLAVLLAISPRARSVARNWLASGAGFAVLATMLTFLLSLGPEIRTEGRLISPTAPYLFLYSYAPGFDGLRVPARYGMVVMVFLSVVAGFGAFALKGRFAAIAILLGLFAIAESIAAPIVINGSGPEAGFAAPPDRMFTGDRVPHVYRFLKTLPAPGTVIVEFPFNAWSYELRYVFYSAVHWHPILNGYSGTFPLGYDLRSAVLRRPEANPDAAWESLLTAGATHAVVHENFYEDAKGNSTSKWLLDRGARLVAEFDGDKVFSLR